MSVIFVNLRQWSSIKSVIPLTASLLTDLLSGPGRGWLSVEVVARMISAHELNLWQLCALRALVLLALDRFFNVLSKPLFYKQIRPAELFIIHEYSTRTIVLGQVIQISLRFQNYYTNIKTLNECPR